MYAVKEVSREEWVFRGLAIAMCLAMVWMAVMAHWLLEKVGQFLTIIMQ